MSFTPIVHPEEVQHITFVQSAKERMTEIQKRYPNDYDIFELLCMLELHKTNRGAYTSTMDL